MKKLLLVATVALVSTLQLNAQSCTPGANYADSTYGVWPDTTQNFPPAAVGVFYSTDLNFKVPDEVTAEVAGNDPIAQGVIGSAIQDFTVTGVTGLPAGIDYACNISSCTYAGGSNGCANLYGTTNTAGTFPITIDVEATVLIAIIPGLPPTPLPVPTSFSGYKLIVGFAGLIEGVLEPIAVHPNPANDVITINGLHDALNIQSVFITNMEGKSIKAVNHSSAETTVDLNGMETGMYFLVVNHATGTETVKFIKE
jgi:hypothetical protein